MGKELDWVREEKSGRLIFRKRYPQAVRPYLAKPGQLELKVPLGANKVMTIDAFKKYDQAKLQWERDVRQAKASMRIQQKKAAAAYDELSPTVVDYIADLLLHDQRNGMEQRLQEGLGRLAHEGWTLILPLLQQARADGDSAALEEVLGGQADELMASSGIRPDPADREGRSRLLWAMNAKLVAAGEEIQRHLQGQAPPIPPRPKRPVKAKEEVRTVFKLIEAYKADKWDGWSLSSRSSVEPVFRLLQDSIGKREVASIDREAAREVFELVKALPKRLGSIPALKNLSVQDAVEKGKRLGLPVIAPKTVNAIYMGHISSMFKWGAKEDWLAKNPFEGLCVVDPVAPEDKRDPFTMEQLQRLFSAAPWQERQADDARKPGLYWLPLIALYSGMRLGEIAGLRIEDIESVEGVLSFRVRPHAARRLKNKESRRVLPIHSALLELGLLAFVESRRRSDDSGVALFPDGKANVRGQSGAKLSEAFQQILNEREIKGTKLGFHSFRHNFEDRLRAVGLHGRAEGQALSGRKVTGSESIYGHGFTSLELQRALEKITYPGLDLTHLAP